MNWRAASNVRDVHTVQVQLQAELILVDLQFFAYVDVMQFQNQDLAVYKLYGFCDSIY